MKNDNYEKKTEEKDRSDNVCNLDYLSEMMGGKKNLIKEIMDAFLKQIPEELKSLNDAIAQKDFFTIKNVSHTMKSSVSIMGMSSILPILSEMEDLGSQKTGIDKIRTLGKELNSVCHQAMEEIEKVESSYS